LFSADYVVAGALALTHSDTGSQLHQET